MDDLWSLVLIGSAIAGIAGYFVERRRDEHNHEDMKTLREEVYSMRERLTRVEIILELKGSEEEEVD